MHKKAVMIAAVILVVIAVSVFFLLRGFQFSSLQNAETTPSVTATESTEDASVSSKQTEHIAEETVLPEIPSAGSSFADEISSSRYSVLKVENTAGEEVSGRVALGASYTSCYLSFDDTHVELLLSPSGETRKGAYEIFDDIISVTYSDGKGAEFRILSQDGVTVSAIVVSYGEYNVYFSK